MPNQIAATLDSIRNIRLIDNGDGSFSLATAAGGGAGPGTDGGVTRGSLTNRSGTIAAGGTSQILMAANTNRGYLIIVNTSDAPLYIKFGGTATTNDLPIAAGSGSFVMEGSFIATDAISIIGATTGKTFVAWEG